MSDEPNWYKGSEPEPELNPPVVPPSPDGSPAHYGPPSHDGAGAFPATPAKRFGAVAVVLGAVGGVFLTVGLAAVFAVALNSFASPDVKPLLAVVLGALVPLVLGLVLAIRRGSPNVRGAGLGLLIGWALTLIVGAGACVALFMALYNPGSNG